MLEQNKNTFFTTFSIFLVNNLWPTAGDFSEILPVIYRMFQIKNFTPIYLYTYIQGDPKQLYTRYI